jgi:hypothetical protein
MKHGVVRQIVAGIARLRKGASTRSGLNSATASSLTESAMSNSMLISWPRARSSQ